MIEKIKSLIKILNEARKAYYQEDREIMSDFEYDKLYDELQELENKTNIIMSNSPTQEVGYMVLESLKKVKHNFKMLSLDKTKDMIKVEEFLGEKKAILSYKMDGLTIVLKYINGKLKNAITRGNGEIGEDVTHNFKVFNNVPLKIPYKDELIIRGEAVISFKEFERINENLEPDQKYKNPRNLCSGTVRQLNNEISKNRNVNFIAFSLIKHDKDYNLKSEQLEFIKNMGFDIVEYKIVDKKNVCSTIKEFEKNLINNKFATDGLVITFDDIEYSRSLGETSKFPKDSLAFKWADNLVKTTLINVEWNTSRTGLINPVAVFEPVELEGTTVNRASLHNISIIKSLKLGIGDTISVYKANMIIPQVAQNFTCSDNLEIPKICYVCGENADIINIRDGLALKCNNIKCRARIINGIVHYVSRNAMNIEGFSEATIDKFIERGFLKNYSDIYFIERYQEQIISMKGFGAKSYQNLINNIEKSKTVFLANYIYALGIEHVGLSNAKILTKNFNFDFEKIMNASVEELISIEGFGDIIAESIVKFFKNDENLNLISKVLKIITIKKEEKKEDLTLENKVFVITGNLEKFKNRNDLQEKIEALGGKVVGSVSKNTDYLINNDIYSTSSKNKKARELNINIINEDDFIDMIK